MVLQSPLENDVKYFHFWRVVSLSREINNENNETQNVSNETFQAALRYMYRVAKQPLNALKKNYKKQVSIL